MNGPGDGDALAQRILQNEELVQRILESAENLSAPMTPEQFMAWLSQEGDGAAPPP